MQVHPDLWLLEYRTRHDALAASAAKRKHAAKGSPPRVRNHRLRSTTATALMAAAQAISPEPSIR
jgi:hypothetical protein